MSRPKYALVVLVDDTIIAEAWSQNDPYPSWSPFWAGEEPLDATTATPRQIGELVQRAWEHSNNEPWRAPDGWQDDGEHTPMARALGMRNMRDVRGAGAKFVYVILTGETLEVSPMINEGRRGRLTGKQDLIELPADVSAAELGQAVLDGLEIAE